MKAQGKKKHVSNKIESARFLEVSYGDNDFSRPVKHALKRLWQFITENNSHLIDSFSYPRGIPEIFIELHRAGALDKMLCRLIDAEYLALEVEGYTRGLCYEEVDWKAYKKLSPIKSITTQYLLIDIKFYKDAKFQKKWQNGECAYLELKAGEVGTR